MIHTQTDIAWTIAMIFFWIGIGLLALGVPSFLYGWFSDSDGPALPFGVGASIVGALVAVICLLITFPPFSMQYHTYRPISGVVQQISSRFLSDGNGTSQKFTVEINGQVYGCNDSRCSQLHVGSPVTLLCEQTFEFNGTPGFDCNWGKYGLNH